MKCRTYFNTFFAINVLIIQSTDAASRSNVACGVRYSREAKSLRIIGGTRASAGDHPWHAYILKSGKQHCGATVIDRQWILTAAHCLKGITEPLRVLVGSYQYRNSFNKGYYRQVAKRVLHPNFDPNVNFQNDIALVKIAPPLTYSAGDAQGRGSVVPICLPKQGQNFQATTARVSGYGLTREEGRPSPMLNTVRVNLLKTGACNRYTGPRKFNPNTQLCAGYPGGGRDSCQGDSGGPLGIVYNDRVTQIGVVSFGQGCGRANWPGVYTKVSMFRRWIDNVVSSQ